MNRRMVFYTLGQIITAEAALLLLPLAVSLYYHNSCAYAFLACAVIAAIPGVAMMVLLKPKNRVIYAKEGFVIVALSWLLLSSIGALPFYLSKEIPSYIDSFFETVSGFTTTGASILTNVEALSQGLLFWRSFTHWIGGMGILVFVLAIASSASSDRAMHIMKAEMPGPIVDKLVPRTRDTAKILYLIYMALTAVEILFLLGGGMPLFEAVLHAFGTAGTGGFGVKNDSVASYSTYIQWVITIFMFLFGINFNIYYMLLLRRIKSVLKSGELWLYVSIAVISCALITVNTYDISENFSQTFTNAAFQVSSIITTTGFTTANYDVWPVFSKAILFLLMLIGACAGSTAGGLKISRLLIIVKSVKKELRHMLHPRSVQVVRFERKPLEEETIRSVLLYLGLYCICFFSIFLILCLEPFSFETNISATAACFNNIGPGFSVVGPCGNYAEYSGFSKIVLSAAMLLGRLEIIPLLLIFTPSTWSKT